MLLVIDLEATCADDGSIPSEEMEIIEIGACWTDWDGNVADRFQAFVRPLERPKLTTFCITLIGIQQNDIDTAPLFPVVAEALQEFIERHRRPDSIWTSWGAYDRKQIERECIRHGITNPISMEHQNAKRLFAKKQRIGKEVGMVMACQLAGLPLEGTHHRGLDDALNIAKLMPWVFGEQVLQTKRPS